LPRSERLTPEEAESLLLKAGFVWLRSKGSHRIYVKGRTRLVIPFHAGRILHPKVAKQVMLAISEERPAD
jgi:predicted RNA binding protein YcfA (HicA-like mRNA interferase family)